MNKSLVHFQPAERIANFQPYFFAALSKKIFALIQKGMDVIRIDIGSPDLPPKDFIIEKLVECVKKTDVHGYTPNGGTPAFRNAIAAYYLNRFDVTLDPDSETLALIGSKEGLFNLAQVMLNPGDIVLVPDPCYPVYTAGSLIAGAEIYTLPLLEKNGFLPDVNDIPEEVLKKTKILWINYPNNPTGAIAPYHFFEQMVSFGVKHNILIAHDAPYTDVCYDGYIAPSIMQVPGAKETCIEFNSASKTYNMAGWRIGMVVGNPEVIRYLHTYKSQMDSSHFAPILDAGISALIGDQSWLEERNRIYQERRDIIVAALQKSGFSLTSPPAAIYIWAKLPTGYSDSTKFCSDLLNETGVSTTPGIVYGKYGEGFIRISLGTTTSRIREAGDRIIDWLSKKRN